MAEISTEYYNSNNNIINEKRSRERRSGERRTGSGIKHFNLPERRVSVTDRRITIFNRLKNEVTDRRSIR